MKNLFAQFEYLIKGSGLMFAARVFALMIGMLSNYVVANYYGSKVLGEYVLVTTVLSLLALIGSFGVQTFTLRSVPEHITKYSYFSVIHYLVKAMLAVLLMSGTVEACILLLTWDNKIHLFGQSFPDGGLRILYWLIIPASLTMIVYEALRGLQNLVVFATMSVFQGSLFLVAILASKFFSHDQMDILNIYLFTFGVQFAIALLVLAALFSTRKAMETRRCVHPTTVGAVLRGAFPMLLSQGALLLMNQFDILMLGYVRTASEVAAYSIASKVALFSGFVLVAVNTITAPKFAELYHSNEIDRLRRLARSSAQFSFWIAAPVIVLFMFFSKDILGLFGTDFQMASYAMMALLTGQIANVACGSVGTMFDMTGKQKIFKNVVLIALIINIVLNLILIPKYGINGAAIASMISVATWNITAAVMVRKYFGFYIGYFPFLSKLKAA